MQSSTVSFVIPAMNEERCLARVLERIKKLSTRSGIAISEIVVVDSGSTDNTREIALEHGCKVVSATPGNVSASRNLGASHCAGDLLAFIDADALLPESWLDECYSTLVEKQALAAGSAITINPDTTSWVEKVWCELAYRSSEGRSISRVEWLPTINILVYREAFAAVSGFREDLVTCEDVDFGQRLSASGQLYRLQGYVDVIHLGESQVLSEFFRREAWRARGEVALLKQRWRKPRDLLSFLLPMLVVITQVTGVAVLLLLLSSLTTGLPALPQSLQLPKLMLGLGLFLLPALLLMLMRRPPPSYFLKGWLLLSIYFWARTTGIVRNFSRVER